jgi:hypothetical protein
MTPRIENAALAWHLDCNNFVLRNVNKIQTKGLLHDDDPRLRDARNMLPGSVYDLHVASVAFSSITDPPGIEQGKLNLNGQIPGAWLYAGVGDPFDPKAARGDVAERLSRKGAANGYTPLDATLRIPAAYVTPGANLGTVNTVILSQVPELKVTDPTITSSGTFAVTWNNAPAISWYGVYTMTAGPALASSFVTLPIPLELIPSLDATKFTSGLFSLSQLPKASGMGDGHSIGVTPDPAKEGDPNEYLGRDMQWHHFDSAITYQPTAPAPNIFLLSVKGENASVTIRSPLAGSKLFYRLNGVSFEEVHPSLASSLLSDATTDISVTIDGLVNGDVVEAYAAKDGYNNSDITLYKVEIISVLESEPPP